MITLQKDTADPQTEQELHALVTKFDEAKNNNDSAAVAALFTEEAILVTDSGPIYGRDAIQKWYEGAFQQFYFSNHLGKADPKSIRVIGTDGNEIWSKGEWSVTLQGRAEARFISTAIGQRFKFERMVLGRIGCRPGT